VARVGIKGLSDILSCRAEAKVLGFSCFEVSQVSWCTNIYSQNASGYQQQKML